MPQMKGPQSALEMVEIEHWVGPKHDRRLLYAMAPISEVHLAKDILLRLYAAVKTSWQVEIRDGIFKIWSGDHMTYGYNSPLSDLNAGLNTIAFIAKELKERIRDESGGI